jgi:Kef-type K+ transport system membrane component KefB
MLFLVCARLFARLFSSYRVIPLGAFLAGIIVPREGGLAIALTEKLEDMVSVVFLPLVCTFSSPLVIHSFRACVFVGQYFTISGLNTNLGLLDDGLSSKTLRFLTAFLYVLWLQVSHGVSQLPSHVLRSAGSLVDVRLLQDCLVLAGVKLVQLEHS